MRTPGDVMLRTLSDARKVRIFFALALVLTAAQALAFVRSTAICHGGEAALRAVVRSPAHAEPAATPAAGVHTLHILL
jgi:hypothetical protein